MLAMPAMLRSGALRSWLTARRKSSFSAISACRRLLTFPVPRCVRNTFCSRPALIWPDVGLLLLHGVGHAVEGLGEFARVRRRVDIHAVREVAIGQGVRARARRWIGTVIWRAMRLAMGSESSTTAMQVKRTKACRKASGACIPWLPKAAWR